MKTPSKKVGITLIVVSILTGSIMFISKIKENLFKKTQTITEKNLSIKVNTDSKNKDTDGDGLTDWEEALWKTDSKNKDTDGDETEDGQEIAQNRNPLIAGPNDKLIDDKEFYNNFSFGKTDENSLTANFAKTLFSNFATMQKDGSISEEESKELTQGLVGSTQKQITLPNNYKAEALNTFDPNDKAKLKEYGNNLVSIQIETLKKMTDDKTSEENLGVISSTYKNIASQLFLMPVPASQTNIHIQMVNNLDKIGIFIDEMKNSKKDPMAAMLLMPEYEKIRESQNLLTLQIANFIKQSGIIYSEGEYGLYLMKILEIKNENTE